MEDKEGIQKLLENLDTIKFSANAVIYKGENYPVIYSEEKTSSWENGELEYRGGIYVMATSEKGLPEDLVLIYPYQKHKAIEKIEEHFNSNIAYISSKDLMLFRSVEKACSERKDIEYKKRKFIMSIVPFGYKEY